MARTLRKAIATVALSGTLADKLEAAALVGFDAVEIMEADLLGFDGTTADLRTMAEDLGIGLDLYQPFAVDPVARAALADWLRRLGFEIVERRGGYAGCGAANAAIRMAGQARRYVPSR